MLYCPMYSVGSKVKIKDDDLEGTIVGIEAKLKVNKSGNSTYQTVYFVEIEDFGVKKFLETQIKDATKDPNAEPNDFDLEMDKFLADSLLLTLHKFPDKNIDKSIKQLLRIEGAEGGNDEGSQGLL